MNDSELLRQFVDTGSDSLFAQIVERHVHAVYWTAHRVLQNNHLAEEVAQDAFCLLARKAAALPPSTILVSWLHRTTWHLAMKTLRGEQRRQAREQGAMTMTMNSPDQESLWTRIEPLLDEAIESLNKTERQAVLLRFFERKPAREIGLALGVNEEAARMRVSRAVEQLRIFFARRGVSLASTALVAMLMDKSVEAAPPAGVQSIQAAVRLAAQSALPPSLGLQLLALMAQIKLKTVVIAGAALLLALLAGRQFQRANRVGSDSVATDSIARALTTNQTRSLSASRLSRFFSRAASSADPTELTEAAALERLREILYSTERDDGMPPNGIAEAIKACGSKTRVALDILLEALKSGDQKAQHRAAASFQFFRGSADELVPELFAVLKTSKDHNLMEYAASSAYVLNPSPDTIPALIEAFKSNSAAADGLQSWFGMYLFHHKSDDAAVVQPLAALLDSEKQDERYNAARILARTTAKDDPRLVAALLPALEGATLQSDATIQKLAFDALTALTKIGPGARSAVDDIRAYGLRFPQHSEWVLNALAATAPDLRTEIPELDAKLKAREEAKALEDRAQKNEVGVASLVEALSNPEARLRAIERLGGLGDRAAEALPRLREILKGGDSDSRPDANNFLFAVATAIRQLDPDAPTYYRTEDLRPVFMDATTELKAKDDKAFSALRDEVEGRMFSPRPLDRNEIAAWAEKLNAADPKLREGFVRGLKRLSAFSQIEIADPELAKALVP
jgi:RNA polymerase sigma factor (sigma-70 family)